MSVSTEIAIDIGAVIAGLEKENRGIKKQAATLRRRLDKSQKSNEFLRLEIQSLKKQVEQAYKEGHLRSYRSHISICVYGHETILWQDWERSDARRTLKERNG